MLQTSLLLNKTETPIFLSVVCSLVPKAIFPTFIGQSHVWVTILRYNILTPTHPHPTPQKSQIGHRFIKMLFLKIFISKKKKKMNNFTLFLAIYYDCLVKARGGSVYYDIIF